MEDWSLELGRQRRPPAPTRAGRRLVEISPEAGHLERESAEPAGGGGRERVATVCRVALAGQEGADGDVRGARSTAGRRQREARDPRTRVRLPDPDAVPAGAIDPLLLADR